MTKVAIAVVESAGHVLVGTRPNGVALAGRAEFPGGKCHSDETTRCCAVRECREETGLMVVPRQHLVTTTHEYDYGTVELDFWRCALSPDVRDLSEPAKPFRWVPFRELRYLEFPDGNHKALELLLLDSETPVILDEEQSRLINQVATAFTDVPRPDHFTDHTHCGDCARHDQTLQAVDRDDLRLRHVGSPVWDPIGFVTDEAWRYLLPGLVRVMVRNPSQYFERFMLHLSPERFAKLSHPEQHAVIEFLSSYRLRIDRQLSSRQGEWTFLPNGATPANDPKAKIDSKLAELQESIES